MDKVESSLFDGITDEEYARMTECFKTTLKTHRKGEEVAMPQGAWAWCTAAGSA